MALKEDLDQLRNTAAEKVARGMIETCGGRKDCVNWLKEQLLTNQDLLDLLCVIVAGGLVVGVIGEHSPEKEEEKKKNESRIITFN